MNWYAVKLLFQSQIDENPKGDDLWEESIRVLIADDEEAAHAEALKVGKDAEHSYLNEAGETVAWHFREVLEVQDLGLSELQHGSEVFSRLFRQ